MTSERDKRVVTTMAECGCELEDLYRMFFKIPQVEVREIFDRVHGVELCEVGTRMSMNCS